MSVSSDSTIITIDLGRDDLNTIKELTDLAVSMDSVFLEIARDGVLDMSGNPPISTDARAC